MKKFLFLFLSLFLIGGLNSVKAEKKYADLSKLQTVGGTNATWEGSTNTITWIGQSNNMVSNFDFAAGDYSSWEKVVVKVSSIDNCIGVRVQIRANGKEKTKPFNGTGTISVDISSYGFDSGDLEKVEWIRMLGSGWYDGESHTINSETPASAVIEEVYLERPDISFIEEKTIHVTPEGTQDINGINSKAGKWDVVYPIICGDGTQFGGNINDDGNSVDITASGYDYLLFDVSDASDNAKINLRVFVSTEESSDNSHRLEIYPHPIAEYASVEDWTVPTTITTKGIYVVKISDYPLLRCIKNRAYWQGDAGSIKISLAYVGKGSPVAPVDKVIRVGEEALTDPSATCFDVTRLNETGLTYNATNLNALFIAKAGQLTNPSNVIVEGVCANLQLTDFYPFKAPYDFTATEATYSRNMEAGAATLCLPFAATIPAGVEAYTLVYNGGEKATATPVETTIPANTPVLIIGSGMKEFAGSSVAIDADADPVVGSLTGVFQDTTVPQNSYVLQNGTSGLGFYKVESDDIVAKPFRAYLTTLFLGARGFIGIDEPTGVNEVKVNKAAAKTGKIYNLNGQIVSKPSKGLYIIDGKVVSF